MSLADLTDRLAVSDVLTRNATAMDTRDWELLASCFTEDARLDYDTSGVSGRKDFVAHRAEGLATMKAPVRGNDATFTLGGTYHDELMCSGADWRIASRRFVTSWKAGTLRD